LAHRGRIGEAIAQYEQALRIEPEYAEAHCNLGIALEKAGRMPEAIQHYTQALNLRPDLTVARNALARLQAGR
jgi:Flp pilus assembly protein TadD